MSGYDPNTPILFFDGECNLCNVFIDMLMVKGAGKSLYIASLQGETAARLLAPNVRQGLDTLVLWEHGNIYIRSSAALRAMAKMGGLWAVYRIWLLVPAFLRDAVYNLIAKNRYKMFGKRESCRVPTEEEKARFLS